MGLPCATGGVGATGERCPYCEHEPLTDGGWQAWDVITRCGGQIRTIERAVVGLDMAAALSIGAALGYNERALAELLPAVEAGLVAGIASVSEGSLADEDDAIRDDR